MKIILDLEKPELASVCDAYLVALWHAGQWNSAPPDDTEACRAAELIGREIIRRWLAATPAELWMRQGDHAKTLPGIARAAKADALVEAVRRVVAQDHGSNLLHDREQSVEAVEQLEKALRAMDGQ